MGVFINKDYKRIYKSEIMVFEQWTYRFFNLCIICNCLYYFYKKKGLLKVFSLQFLGVIFPPLERCLTHGRCSIYWIWWLSIQNGDCNCWQIFLRDARWWHWLWWSKDKISIYSSQGLLITYPWDCY